MASVMTETLYDRQDSGYPESLIALETQHIRKNYKKLKEEMEPNEILDYLVQYDILDTDENTHLLKECRARKCDFILRKLIKYPEKFTKMMEHITKARECGCFRYMLCSITYAMESSNDGLESSNPNLCNLKHHGKHREKLLTEISKRINVESSNSILDDFLQEDLISVDEHEEISRITNKYEAAKKILEYSEKKRLKSFSRKLLSILKYYNLNDLAESLQQDEAAEGDTTGNEIPLTVDMVDGRMFLSTADMSAPSTTVKQVEMKITYVDGSERVYRAMIQGISESEEMIVQRTHSTIDRLSEGSITIWLHTASSDAKEKLRHFIESGDISKLLESLFKTKGVRKLLTKDKYKIQIEIKEVKDATEGSKPTAFLPKKESGTRYKTCLDRCESFLLEELEPGCLVRDTEVGHVFSPVKAGIENVTNRTDRVKLLLEHLRKESEEKIKLVLDRLKEKNRFVYDKLFPNVEKFQDLDIEQIKSNILDSLPEILGAISVAALQTPFLSAGIMSKEELDSLRRNSECVRTENLHFVQMVLDRGDEAVMIFLVALENSSGMDIQRLLNKTETLHVSEDKRRNAKIEYEAFNEENGLLFQGNFLLELMSEDKTEKNMNAERLCVREEEPQQHIEHPGPEHRGSQSEESTSSDSDSSGIMQRNVPSKESRIKELESDTSSILSKLTRKLGKVEYVVDIRCILSTRDVSESARMERVKRKYLKKYDAIKEEVLKLNTVLTKLQSLSRIFKDKVGVLTSWNDDDKDDAAAGDDDGDDDDHSDDGHDDDYDDDNDDATAGDVDHDDEFDDATAGDDDGDDDDNEPPVIEDLFEALSETTLRFKRQTSDLVVKSTDEDSTMDSDEDVQEDLNVLSRKSSKYQSILVGKLHELEIVQSVMNIFRDISEEEIQLMAVKNILNEEQYKKLEKYIIKLQIISNKIEEATSFAKVA